MSSGGSVQLLIVIDFSGIDGTLVVARPPEEMNVGAIGAKANEIYNTVLKAYEDDYAKYATGGFDTLEAIRKELDKIRATVITYEQERYL